MGPKSSGTSCESWGSLPGWGLWQDSQPLACCNMGVFLTHLMYRCHLLDPAFLSEGTVLPVAVDSLCLCERVVLEPSMLPSGPPIYLHKHGLAGSSIRAGAHKAAVGWSCNVTWGCLHPACLLAEFYSFWSEDWGPKLLEAALSFRYMVLPTTWNCTSLSLAGLWSPRICCRCRFWSRTLSFTFRCFQQPQTAVTLQANKTDFTV